MRGTVNILCGFALALASSLDAHADQLKIESIYLLHCVAEERTDSAGTSNTPVEAELAFEFLWIDYAGGSSAHFWNPADSRWFEPIVSLAEGNLTESFLAEDGGRSLILQIHNENAFRLFSLPGFDESDGGLSSEALSASMVLMGRCGRLR